MSGQRQRDHLHGQDLENWVNGSRCVGQGEGRRRRAFTNQLCSPLLFANILEKALVQVASLVCAAEDQDESLVAEHFKRTVAKCRAAHSFAVEVVGLFNNQSTRANGGERSPLANQEQVPNTPSNG